MFEGSLLCFLLHHERQCPHRATTDIPNQNADERGRLLLGTVGNPLLCGDRLKGQRENDKDKRIGDKLTDKADAIGAPEGLLSIEFTAKGR